MMRLFIPLWVTASATLASAVSLDGIRSLAKRQIPAHAHSFEFELINGTGNEFVVSDSRNSEGGISVECTNPSSCARGLYTYLTEIGKVDISWTGSNFHRLPARLPPVGPDPINGSSIVDIRYYFNTVTFSYTTVWYTFEQWSQLIDWMALRGINFPLAWVGYEQTLVQVFREAGLSDSGISSFLSGPAFQSWNRFGNIQSSWGGDLPEAWMDDQFALQKQILPRLVELGMTPILPAFTGFVPIELREVYPNASVVNGSQWVGFPTRLTEVNFLNPSDELFATLQKSFLTKQQEAYGANITKYYTLDQYNENSPFKGDIDYLRNVSLNTYKSLSAVDPDAVLVMQGWLFFIDASFWTIDRIEAFLGGVPDDSMLILDLYAEAQPQWQRTSSYFGKPWVWCQLHDFGQNQGLEGYLTNLTVAPVDALNSPGSTMKGLGLTMEGQEGNEIVYDLLLDQAWSRTPIDISRYISSWVARRYVVDPLPQAAQHAWSILGASVYNNTDPASQATIKSVLELAPSLTGMLDRTALFYDTNSTVLRALELLLQASKDNTALRNVPEFAYDVVDVTRQLLANRFIDIYKHLIATYNDTSSTVETVTAAGKPLLTLLSDLDALLMTNENFLLSRWIRDARSWAKQSDNDTYAHFLEFNARNQITLWGPDGEIDDYASKQWGGLVASYYLPRWEAFTTYLAETKREGKEYNGTEIAQELLVIGMEWDLETWGQREGETWGTRGDTWVVVEDVLEKWA